MIKISIATLDDIPEVVSLGHIAAKEFNRRYDPARVGVYAEGVIQKPNQEACCLVAKNEDSIVGFFVGSKVEDGFSDTILGVEQHWYVLPEFRNTRAGYYLIDAFLYWCKAVHCDEILISDGDHETVGRFLKKRGFSKSISVYKG